MRALLADTWAHITSWWVWPALLSGGVVLIMLSIWDIGPEGAIQILMRVVALLCILALAVERRRRPHRPPSAGDVAAVSGIGDDESQWRSNTFVGRETTAASRIRSCLPPSCGGMDLAPRPSPPWHIWRVRMTGT